MSEGGTAMDALMRNVMPLILLMAFGAWLRRRRYFSEETVKQNMKLIGNVLAPCILFETLRKLEVRTEYMILTVSFFCLLVLFLAISLLIYHFFPVKRKFFPFFGTAFAFGLMGIPLFSSVYGAEHMGELTAMGVAHEVFFATVYLPIANLMFRGEKTGGRAVLKNLFTPILMMVFTALTLNISGLGNRIEATLWGACFFRCTALLGSVSTVMAMVMIGYQIHFENRGLIRESALYVIYRYALVFGVGYPVKWLLLDRIPGLSHWFGAAYFIMLSQFGSTLLVAMVGQYETQEDLEVAGNSFALNVIAGIVFYLIYLLVTGTSF